MITVLSICPSCDVPIGDAVINSTYSLETMTTCHTCSCGQALAIESDREQAAKPGVHVLSLAESRPLANQ